jgi:hypothetical protein
MSEAAYSFIYEDSFFVIQRVTSAIDEFEDELESLPNAIRIFAQCN